MISDHVNTAEKNRNNIFAAFLSSTLIAIGINILTNNLAQVDLLLFSFGFMSILAGGFLAVVPLLENLKSKKITIPVVLLFGKNNKPIEIPRYSISENISRCLEAVFTERSELKKLWEGPFFTHKFTGNTLKIKKNDAGKLLDETLEYELLGRIQNATREYFNEEERREKLSLVNRGDLSRDVLKNRVLDIISMPMHLRPKFKEKEQTEEVMAQGQGRMMFQKFMLELPKQSILKRDNKGRLVVTTNKWTLKFSVENDGFSTTLPTEFDKLYLKKDPEQIYQMHLIVEIRTTIKGLFTNLKELHGWMDILLKDLEDISFDKFIKKIDWESNLTGLQISRAKSNL